MNKQRLKQQQQHNANFENGGKSTAVAHLPTCSDPICMMLSSKNDALCHINSYILSWKSLDIKKEELFSKVNTVLTEYARRCYDVDQFGHYEFISIQKLLDYGTVYQSKINSSALRELAQYHQDQKIAQGLHHQLLVGFITNQPKEISSKLGQIFIEDSSGAVDLLCIDARPCLLGSLVIITEWTFIPCLNNRAKPYVEVKSSVLELYNHGESPQHKLGLVAAENPREQRSKKEVSLSERIYYLSPIHRISGSDPFFMVKLESTPQPVIVLGKDKMCWWHFLKPGLTADFLYIKHSKLNKGSMEERDILKTTLKSRIAIFNEKQGEIAAMITNGKNSNIISYSGTITDCTMADRGIFELDKRSKLIVAHQPCESYCVGLRIGARICAYNVHMVVSANIPYLVCCTCSTVKVVEHSSLLADHKPFVQLHNFFTKDCQEVRVKDYVHWIRLSDDLRKRFTFLSEKSAAGLGKLLLNEYLSYKPVKRNVFQEFFSEPHRCIVSSENHATPPKVWSLAKITSKVHTFFIQSSETVPWSKGDQYDRLSNHTYETGNSWSYKVLSPENVGNVVILGELGVCHVDGQLALKDESGFIAIEVIPNRMQSGEHRDEMCRSVISKIASDEKSIFVLRRYFIVLEKTKKPGISSHNCELYLLTDPEADGNFMFSYKRSTPQQSHAYKRKQVATNMNGSVSKRKRREDGGLLALQNGELRESSTVSDVLRQEHSSAESRIAFESSLAPRENPFTVACSSKVSRTERNDLPFVEAEIKLFTSKMSENYGKSADSMEGMVGTPVGEKIHAGKGSLTGVSEQNTPKEKESIKEKADDNKEIFANESENREFGCAEKAMENILPLNSDEYCQKNRTKSVHIEKEHGASEVCFLVIFIRKVTVLQTIQRGGSVYCCTTIYGFSIGRLKFPESGGKAADHSATSSISDVMTRGRFRPKFMMDGDCKFEAINHKRSQLQLVIDTRFKSDYALIKSGNFYLIESTKNIANTSNNIIIADLKLRLDSALHLAELEQEKLKVKGRTILLPKDCIKSIRNALKLYYENCGANTSVRSTLMIGKTYRDRVWSFSGLIVSRSVKTSSPWCIEDRTSVVLLRVKDFVSLDEIVVYIYPSKFCIPSGCLPGAHVHFKDIEIKVSQARKVYCTATAATEIRILCFNKSELDRLSGCLPINSVSGLSDPTYRKTLTWFLGNAEETLNLIWEVKLDFLAVRWAVVYWKCRVCNQKVHQLICTRGCPQEWKLITQLSVVVDDGTTQAYLQIEQSLFRRFLALPAAQWLPVLEAAKCEELTYPGDIASYAQKNFSPTVQFGSNTSQIRQAEIMLWKLFSEISERPTCIVHCRLFSHGEKITAQD